MMNWIHPERQPTDDDAGNLAYSNFDDEKNDPIAILIREVFQNLVDAKIAPSAVAKKVSIRLLTENDGLDVSYINRILEGHNDRITASSKHLKADLKFRNALIIEENGFEGLTGPLDNLEDSEDENRQRDHHRNFYFSKATPKKVGATLGRANQGKITYFNASEYKTVFSLSRRFGEDTPLALFGASEFKRTYKLKDQRFKMKSFWGDGSDQLSPKAETSLEKCKEFADAFCLGEFEGFGTSWIIPNVNEADFEPDVFLRYLVDEFCSIFMTDGFEVNYRGEEITSSNIDEIAAKYAKKLTPGSIQFQRDFITTPDSKFFTVPNLDWFRAKAPKEKADFGFTADDHENLSTQFETSRLIPLKFPIHFKDEKGRAHTTHLKVAILKDENLSQSDIIFKRGDLEIKEEPDLRGFPAGMRVMALADDPVLSELLALAENGSHTKFNNRDEKLDEPLLALEGLRLNTQGRQTLISSVRHACFQASRIFNDDEKTDFSLFSDLFSIPGEHRKNRNDLDIEDEDDDPTTPDVDVDIDRKPKLLRIRSGATGKLTISLNPIKDKSDLSFPIIIRGRLAYDQTSKNPFSDYDPDFDFNLNDMKISTIAATVSRAEKNEFEVEFRSDDAKLEIEGFAKIALKTIVEVETL